MYTLGSEMTGGLVTAWGDFEIKPDVSGQLGWLVKSVQLSFTPDIFKIISTLTCLTAKFVSVWSHQKSYMPENSHISYLGDFEDDISF